MKVQTKVDRIFIHTTDSGPETTKEMVRKWHVDERGWDDIGYHYIILDDGTRENARDPSYVPAAQRGNNSNTIAIALVGRGHYRVEQLLELKMLLIEVMRKYELTIDNIWAHNEVSEKPCPYFESSDVVHLMFKERTR